MKLLVTSNPLYGHFFPMLPLIEAARAAGAEVKVATGPELGEELDRRDLSWWSIGDNFADAIAAAFSTHESEPVDPRQALERQVLAIFGYPGIARARDVVPLALDWRPDVVLHELADLAGWEVAAVTRALDVAHGYGPQLPFSNEIASLLTAEVARQIGTPDRFPRIGAAAYVDPWPVSLRSAEPLPFADLLPIQPVTEVPPPGADLPELADLPYEKTIYATFGTVFNRPDSFEPLLAAVAGMEVNVIVTTGPTLDPAELGATPTHVVVRRFVPQGLVLPRCAAVVSHAGSGTVLGALVHELPQVCLPSGADQFVNAEGLARNGAGIVLPPDARTPTAIASAIAAVLTDPRYAVGAAGLHREITAMPTADQVWAVLTDRIRP